jgi:hypothetical protein
LDSFSFDSVASGAFLARTDTCAAIALSRSYFWLLLEMPPCLLRLPLPLVVSVSPVVPSSLAASVTLAPLRVAALNLSSGL